MTKISVERAIQARKALNRFRHLPTTSLSEKELTDYIVTLKRFLENSGPLKQLPDVQDAILKLSKLEKEGDIFDTKELKDKIEEEIKQAEKSDSSTFLKDLQNLREELQRAYGNGILNIDLHTQKAMAEIDAHVEKHKRHLSENDEMQYKETCDDNDTFVPASPRTR
ncbi:hypothetical protein MAR_028935 [Mya arenaria]|uniref:Uncharacterized protein n=1 Tax=Mya arenaria TaxID=6604 RepID=A0ABY7DML7_MYAAR|nr:hypothetical protein MAR_028935 [Mya arenaria]